MTSSEKTVRRTGAAPPSAATLLILNPTAAGGRAAGAWARLRDELRHWPLMPEVVETQHAAHGTDLARQAVAAGAGLVIAAGGDGTAHEVVQGLMQADAAASGTAFAHLPLGTGCDLARGLGLPAHPSGLLRRLRRGTNTRIDVGVADMSDGAGTVRRYFLNGASVGLGPTVARRVKEGRMLRRLGRHAYRVASVREIFAARPHQISWRADDGPQEQQPVLLMCIGNGPSVGGGMRPSPEASFTSGALHVVVAGPMGWRTALSQFRRMERGLDFNHPGMTRFSCRTIDLQGSRIDVETDGEIAAGLPARLSARAAGLLVRMPA